MGNNVYFIFHTIIFFICIGSLTVYCYSNFWIKRTNFIENHEIRIQLCKHNLLSLRIFLISVFLLSIFGSISYFRHILWICS